MACVGSNGTHQMSTIGSSVSEDDSTGDAEYGVHAEEKYDKLKSFVSRIRSSFGVDEEDRDPAHVSELMRSDSSFSHLFCGGTMRGPECPEVRATAAGECAPHVGHTVLRRLQAGGSLPEKDEQGIQNKAVHGVICMVMDIVAARQMTLRLLPEKSQNGAEFVYC